MLNMSTIVFNPEIMNWNEYIWNIRYNLMIYCNIKSDAIIVEVAPWYMPKIGLWIMQIDFYGTIYIIEPDSSALESIVKQYRKLMPNANIISVLSELKDALQFLPKKVDMLCSNHPLDDMIISYATYATSVENYYGEVYGEESSSSRVWNHIGEHKQELLDIHVKILLDWESVIQYVNPSRLIVSQYKSFYYQSNNIFLPDQLANDLLKWLKLHYKNDQNVQSILKQHSQNIEEWCISRVVS